MSSDGGASVDAYEKLRNLSNVTRFAADFVITISALLIVLFGVMIYSIITEELSKWKKPTEKVTIVEKRRKRRQISKASKASKSSKVSNSSKASKSTKSKQERGISESGKVSQSSKVKKGKKETSIKEVKAAYAKEVSKKDGTHHVTFINGKEDSKLTAPKYQMAQTKWPSTIPSLPISTRSDVSARSKQNHDSKCPGTDSFGTTASSFSSGASSSRHHRLPYDDRVQPLSNEALTQGTYLRRDMVGMPESSKPRIYKPCEVPSQFASDGAVTAREDTDPLSLTKTAQSPRSSTLSNLRSGSSNTSVIATEPTQTSITISTTQPTTPAVKSQVASTQSWLSVADTQESEKTLSTPTKNLS